MSKNPRITDLITFLFPPFSNVSLALHERRGRGKKHYKAMTDHGSLGRSTDFIKVFIEELNFVSIPWLGIMQAFQEQNEEEGQLCLSSENLFAVSSLRYLYFFQMFLP